MRKTIFLLLIFFYSPFCLAQDLNYDYALSVKKSGNYKEAEQIFLSLIEQDKNNSELWFQLGLVQRMQGKMQDSMNSQRKALKISPKNNDVKLELARLSFFEKKYDEAQKITDEILRDNPKNYAEVEELVSGIKKAKSADLDYYKWQLDIGHELSRFSRVAQNNWQENFMQIGFRPQKSTLTHLRFNDVRRFNVHNEQYEIGIDHNFGKNYTFGVDVGYGADSTFLPKWQLKARGSARVIRDNKYFGDTWLLADARKDRYQHFDIFIFRYGASYFITKNLELKGLLVNVVDQNDHNIGGWTSRLDWQTPLPKLRIYAGISVAPETQNAVVVNTKGKFFGGAYDINKNVTLNLGYTREDRENSFIRKVFSTSLSMRF